MSEAVYAYVELGGYSTKDVVNILSSYLPVPISNRTGLITTRTLINWRDRLCLIKGIDGIFGELLITRGSRQVIESYDLKHLKLFLIYGYYSRVVFPMSSPAALANAGKFINSQVQLLTDDISLEELFNGIEQQRSNHRAKPGSTSSPKRRKCNSRKVTGQRRKKQ